MKSVWWNATIATNLVDSIERKFILLAKPLWFNDIQLK